MIEETIYEPQWTLHGYKLGSKNRIEGAKTFVSQPKVAVAWKLGLLCLATALTAAALQEAAIAPILQDFPMARAFIVETAEAARKIVPYVGSMAIGAGSAGFALASFFGWDEVNTAGQNASGCLSCPDRFKTLVVKKAPCDLAEMPKTDQEFARQLQGYNFALSAVFSAVTAAAVLACKHRPDVAWVVGATLPVLRQSLASLHTGDEVLRGAWRLVPARQPMRSFERSFTRFVQKKIERMSL